MIDEQEIRKLVISGKSDFIRDLLLTQSSVNQLLELYCQGEFTAAFFAKHKNISIQNASTSLAKHYRRGYLARRTDSAISGGVEYVYFLPDWARESL